LIQIKGRLGALLALSANDIAKRCVALGIGRRNDGPRPMVTIGTPRALAAFCDSPIMDREWWTDFDPPGKSCRWYLPRCITKNGGTL